MIHIFSLHFKDDKWADIQLDSIKKHIKVPYKTYAVYSHMSDDIYNKRRTQYDYFLNKEDGKHIHKNGKFLDDGKQLLNDYIKPEELWACTSCNACVEACPLNIEPLSIIIDLRRYLVMEESAAPS